MTVSNEPDDELAKFSTWITNNAPSRPLMRIQDVPEESGINELCGLDGLADLRAALSRIRLPTKREFFPDSDYGTYRFVRSNRGKSWTVYVSGGDFPDGEEKIGTFNSMEILDLVDGWDCSLDPLAWTAMGWRPS